MATWSGIRLPGRWTGEGGEGSVETGNPGETEEGAELTLPRRVNSGAEGRTKNTEGAEPALQPSTENHVPVNSASKTRTAHATRQAHSKTASHDPASGCRWLRNSPRGPSAQHQNAERASRIFTVRIWAVEHWLLALCLAFGRFSLIILIIQRTYRKAVCIFWDYLLLEQRGMFCK